MELQIYDCNIVDNHNNIGMDEYFNWTNAIKIDEGAHTGKLKKRKCADYAGDNEEAHKLRKNGDDKHGADERKLTNGHGQPNNSATNGTNVNTQNVNVNGTSRMPQWQVDDITDLNADIEGSFNGLTSGDHSNNSFNMSEAILSLSNMAVLKQEAPSPPNDYRQQAHSPNNQHSMNQENSNGDQGTNAMLNATIQQLLSHSGFNSTPNAIEGHALNASNQDSYGFAEDCRFQYVLAAATSIATKLNEDTLTYLNQGQSYEIKLKKLGDLSMYRGKLLRSVIKICFHERRLQYMEKEQMTSWQQSRPGDRILEVDVPLSYGLCNVQQPNNALNTVQFSWDPTKEVGAYIKVNCISTEFTQKKHGGEKGVPFRIQVETYQAGDAFDSPKRLHAAACQIKVFKLKGADRKHKQDREKILKRSLTEQETYQPSYECTVLNDIPNDLLPSTPPIVAPYSPDSGNQAPAFQNVQIDEAMVSLSPASSHHSEKQPEVETGIVVDSLLPASNPQQTVTWLNTNRFEKFVSTFTNFSGADMLRMSRDDLIQICGHAEGIRLYNGLHSKTVAPKLTLYMCKENSTVFNAIFLQRLSNHELIQKLSALLNVQADNVKDIYVHGPQMIHVQLNSEMMQHLKDETMFNVEIINSNSDGKFVILLKPINKN
ncbi:transcription factor CP2-like protein 1 isoform X1 [Atheta coriaria]|uniref:transcription factor CP2-like protein 1 isoform X1 n=2 Tax=Dalotia coriaria TaxID=877792 RepID=UPI0031F44570